MDRDGRTDIGVCKSAAYRKTFWLFNPVSAYSRLNFLFITHSITLSHLCRLYFSGKIDNFPFTEPSLFRTLCLHSNFAFPLRDVGVFSEAACTGTSCIVGHVYAAFVPCVFSKFSAVCSCYWNANYNFCKYICMFEFPVVHKVFLHASLAGGIPLMFFAFSESPLHSLLFFGMIWIWK